MENKPFLGKYLPEFMEEMNKQLTEDEKRWGHTWADRPVEGQEYRIKERFDSYFDQFKNADQPIPWLKIACLSLIAWVRIKHGGDKIDHEKRI